MSNKLTKLPSPLDMPVKCGLCGQSFYGPTDDMNSERGARFAAALFKHISMRHPERSEAIAKMSDLFASWCAYTLFVGDEHFEQMKTDQQHELKKIVHGLPADAPVPSSEPEMPVSEPS